ncbi:MAG: protein kinase domain-containing protein, partial [Planctomycetota bacterium]
MAQENRCPQCGAKLPIDAPEGLCPKCLMKVVQKNDADFTLDESPLLEGPGTKIGHYELLELIGEGGMGLVYLAEQKEPVKRNVALKIIKPGMDSKQVIARFEAERQALALLDHPNIAHVFDAGTTETGRPYFVMEYVRGMSITRYCDEHRLDVEQRLRLFREVCEGVHHAHQKGIIHRDIKPSNILISMHVDRAVPKIIDFGIAKAAVSSLTEKTMFTFQGQLLGTPEYMSPEQVDLATQDIDTRSDIYSLGVVLYELLAGVLPFERESLQKIGFAELQRTLRELEPASPSIRLSNLGEQAKAIADSRMTQVVPLARRLHRELEWIPLKAMRKDRCRRYKSASDMADDIRNYLNGNPLLAGPETAMYRVKKFVHKHAGSVATVVLVAVAIVLALIVSTTMYFRAEDARQKEAVARAQAEQAKEKETMARTQAEQAEQATKEKAEELRRTLYVNSIQLADAKYQEGNTSHVRELLASCPNDLRGWEWSHLNHISDQSIMTIRQPDVRFVMFSPNGKHIVAAGRDGSIKVLDATSGSELMTLRGHADSVSSIDISADGKRLVSSSWDKTIKLWDMESGAELRTFRGHDKSIRHVVISRDGRRLASSALDETIKIWDTNTGSEITVLKNIRQVGRVALSPDGKYIASASGKEVKIWDTNKGIEISTIPEANSDWTACVAYSPDGKYIVSCGGWDSRIAVWDTSTGTEVLGINSR